MHFIIQPLLWITVGQITRELPCNSRLEFFAVSQLHFDILARQDHTTWFNHSLLCQPKTAWQSGLQCCVSPHEGDRHTAGLQPNRNAFHKGAICAVCHKDKPHQDCSLYCTPLATLLTSTWGTIIPLVWIVLALNIQVHVDRYS